MRVAGASGELLVAERRDISAFLAQLGDEEWRLSSLCGDWTVMEVAAHLASFLTVPVRGLATRMMRAGFSPSRANRQGVTTWADRGQSAIAAALGGTDVPGVARVYAKVGLTEAVVHHQDMRRALGRQREVPEERLRIALGVISRWPTGTGGNRRRRGVGLRATDMDWSLGSGPEVLGRAEALLMALAGRHQALDELSGEGIDLLARSFS